MSIAFSIMDAQEDADDYIKICEEEGGDFMEFPKESDSTLLLSTLTAQFPNAIGLKYRAPSGALRALRFQVGTFLYLEEIMMFYKL